MLVSGIALLIAAGVARSASSERATTTEAAATDDPANALDWARLYRRAELATLLLVAASALGAIALGVSDMKVLVDAKVSKGEKIDINKDIRPAERATVMASSSELNQRAFFHGGLENK